MSDETTPEDEVLAFTVRSIWRENRISCPHPDILRAHAAGSLPADAAEFVAFHLQDSQCPYCASVLEDQRAQDLEAGRERLESLRDKVMRSTVAALRESRDSRKG